MWIGDWLGARRLGSVALLGVAAVACADDGGRDQNGSLTAASISVSAGSVGDSDSVEDDGADETGVVVDVGQAGTAADDSGAGDCEEIVDEAELGPRPQDIIFAIDTSGSMFEEAEFVQAQMNSFSIQIDAAMVDARIMLLAEYPPIFGPGVCIDPPLGSGGCPSADSNPPKFLHVPDSDIGSSNALSRLIELYPGYSPFVRENALTHIVVVSDDNSAMSADDFSGQFAGLSEHLSDFVFHGIVSSIDPDLACDQGSACCTLAASQGTVYQELIAATGGVEGNLCDQEFQPVFGAVAQQVIGGASLACSYQIPPPPPGESFDRDRVNVEFEDADGVSLSIGRVDSEAACAGVEHGWYYDDPIDPTRIFVCPQTCDTIQGFEAGKVAIKFGCATIPAG